MTRCPSCAVQVSGEYCWHCGQRVKVEVRDPVKREKEKVGPVLRIGNVDFHYLSSWED